MTSTSEVAAALRDMERRALGVSSDRLQRLGTDAERTSVLNLMKKSGPPFLKHRVGGWLSGQGTIDTLLLTEDVMVVGPVLIGEFIVVDEIALDVTTAGTEGNLYTALYADTGKGMPGSLIHASAALGVTAGVKSTTGLDIELPPGLYWAGAVCNQVTTTVATVRSLINNSPYVCETDAANDINAAGYSMAAQTGAPPATFTATATVVAEAPKVMLKVKSR